MLRRLCLLIILSVGLAATARAQQNRIDVVTPLAPELATYGKYGIGVRTLQATDRNRPDVLNTKEGEATAQIRSDADARGSGTRRRWRPVRHAGGDYRAITRDPAVTATLHGKAVRDAAPLTSAGGFPLVVVSHGYPGNRYLLSHLCENLASKGFVVRFDRPHGQHVRRPATIREHALQPSFDQLFAMTKSRASSHAARAAFSTDSSTPSGQGSSGTQWAATAW